MSLLELEQITAIYGATPALFGVDLSIEEGEVVALMGRNGMGKTTLFKSLIGILPSTGGSISVDDVDVTKQESYQRVKNGIAYVPQGRMIFPSLTVQENIETGMEVSKLKKIPDDIFSLFPVLHEMRKRKGGNLSGGQQQQLAIARALVNKPALVLADEPTGNLDHKTALDIYNLMRELNQESGTAFLVVTHDNELAAKLDKQLSMQDGRFITETVRSTLNKEQEA